MRKAFKMTALLLAIVMLAAFAGCKKDAITDDKPQTGGEAELTDAQIRRAKELASAFRLFGECDVEKGIDIRSAEYMVFCMYTGRLERSDVEGYGIVSLEDANGMLAELFKGFDPKSMLHTKYDAEKEQPLYYSEGRYFVLISDLSSYDYEVTRANELVGAKGQRLGDVLNVKVLKDGQPETTIVLELYDSESAVYSIRKCSFEQIG